MYTIGLVDDSYYKRIFIQMSGKSTKKYNQNVKGKKLPNYTINHFKQKQPVYFSIPLLSFKDHKYLYQVVLYYIFTNILRVQLKKKK